MSHLRLVLIAFFDSTFLLSLTWFYSPLLYGKGFCLLEDRRMSKIAALQVNPGRGLGFLSNPPIPTFPTT